MFSRAVQQGNKELKQPNTSRAELRAGHNPGGVIEIQHSTSQNTVTVTARAHSANHRGARKSHGREPNTKKRGAHLSLARDRHAVTRARAPPRAGTWRRRENHAGHVHLRAVISAGRGCAARCLRRDRRGGGALVEGVRVRADCSATSWARRLNDGTFGTRTTAPEPTVKVWEALTQGLSVRTGREGQTSVQAERGARSCGGQRRTPRLVHLLIGDLPLAGQP